MNNFQRATTSILSIVTIALSAAPSRAQTVDADAALFRDNVVIVLDASGSMNERMHTSNMTRMQAAKQALTAVIGQVPDNTQVGLVVFSAQNLHHNDEWIYDLQPVDRGKLAQAILLPKPGGGTPLGAYLKVGADRLLQQREAQRGYGTFRLLVVTDGIASDPILVERYLPDIQARGIVVDVIGVDMKEDHPLATRVRSYRRANDPDSLVKAVTSALSEVSSQGPQDTTSKEEFELVAAFPPEMASAALAALTASGNHPIGEKARPHGAGNPPAHEATPPWTPAAPVQQHDSGALLAVPLGCGFIVLVFLGFVFVFILAGRSKSRHHGPSGHRRRH